MRIVIDLRLFGTKVGGLGRYNQEFLNQLIKIDHNNEYILIFREEPKIELPSNFKVEICDCRWYSWKEQFVMPYLLYKLKPNLVHFPHFNVPIFYNGKFIVTIHDLIMTKFPSQRASTLIKILFKIKYWFYQQVIRHAVINAEKVIAVSKFTAADIKKHFHLTDQQFTRVKVIYEGVSTCQSSQVEPFNLPRNYFLYVGNAYPHKNLEFLIDTFKDFLKKYPEYYLILVGNKNYFYKRLAKETDCDNIIFAGHISDDVLSTYYQNAKAYIFPSKYEGFGLPPLEAMSYGLPVLSSNASCLPEVLGRSALYFDPEDKNDLASKMEEIIKDDQFRAQLIKFGKQQIEKYSWREMAIKILEVYKNKC